MQSVQKSKQNAGIRAIFQNAQAVPGGVTVLFTVCLLIFAAALSFSCVRLTALTQAKLHADIPVLLLDAGHGGEDGGAVAANGLQEKDVNLSVALSLRQFLWLYGAKVQMVRDGDYAVGDNTLSTVRERKSSDLKARVKMVQQTGDCVLISIHQNFFEQSQYSGTQVFYSANNADSKQLAQCLQQSAVMLLQPDNSRQVKLAQQGIYLLSHVQVPAVIVECGFLSNPQEAQLLGDETYQKQMAFSVFCGIEAYFAQQQTDLYQ